MIPGVSSSTPSAPLKVIGGGGRLNHVQSVVQRINKILTHLSVVNHAGVWWEPMIGVGVNKGRGNGLWSNFKLAVHETA